MRNHQIDFLRGIAILLVLGRHCPILPAQAGFLNVIASLWYNCGWMGVDLFFVLSGFLIGSSLMEELKKEKTIRLFRFLLKRALKIWPAYFLLIFFLSSGLTIQPHEKQNLIWNWLHLQNYMGSCRAQTWSLAVEEHFYIFLPILLLLLSTRVHLFPLVTALIAVFCLVGRCLDPAPHSYFFTHLRIDALMFGVLLAYLKVFRFDVYEKLSAHPRLLLCAGIFLVMPSALLNLQHDWFVITFGLTLNYLGFGAILLALLKLQQEDGIVGGILFSRLAYGIGRIGFFSYGIYLWHMDLGFIPALAIFQCLSALPHELSWICGMALFVAFSVWAGAWSSKLIEIPFLRGRDKLVRALFDSKSAAIKESVQTAVAQVANAETLIVKPSVNLTTPVPQSAESSSATADTPL